MYGGAIYNTGTGTNTFNVHFNRIDGKHCNYQGAISQYHWNSRCSTFNWWGDNNGPAIENNGLQLINGWF